MIDLSCQHMGTYRAYQLLEDGTFDDAQHLNLSHNGLNDAFLHDLIPKLNQPLVFLDLSHNALSQHSLVPLLKHIDLSQLEHLNLSHTKCRHMTLLALAKTPDLSQLQHLNLENSSIQTDHLKVLFSNHALEKLKSLNLSRVPFSLQDIKALVNSPFFSTLQSLRLDHCKLDPQGLDLLCSRIKEAQIEELAIAQETIDLQSIRALSSLPIDIIDYHRLFNNSDLSNEALIELLPYLQPVDYWHLGPQPTPELFLALSQSNLPSQVERLYIHSKNDRPPETEQLAGLEHVLHLLVALETLCISTSMTDHDLEVISTTALPKLKSLRLLCEYPQYTSRGLMTLANAPILVQLEELSLTLANGTRDFIEALADRHIQDLTIKTGYGTAEDWVSIQIENGVICDKTTSTDE